MNNTNAETSGTSPLITTDPIALVHLMDQTLFNIEEPSQEGEPVKLDEVAKPEEPVRVQEPIKPEEPVKVEELVKPEEPVKLEDPVKLDEPKQVAEPVSTYKIWFQMGSKTEKPPVNLSFIGNVAAPCLFIFHHAQAQEQHQMLPQEMEAFEKILGALKLRLDQIALLNLAIQQPSFDLMVSKIKPQKMVLLGAGISMETLGLSGINLPLHQPSHIQQLPVLQSYSFQEMDQDVDKKRVFWNALKLHMSS